MSDRPALDLSFSVAGPGVVGTSLAHWLAAAGGRARWIAARRLSAAEELAAEVGGAAVELAALSTAGDDLLLLAVADDALAPLATQLARRPQADTVLHVAGGRDAAVLAPLAAAGSAVGTFHPLRAFPRPSRRPREGRDTVFTLDGDAGAVALGFRLASALGGYAVEIDAAARPLYHLAASLAAGGVVTVLAAADELARELRLPRRVSRALFDLARQALAAARDAEPPATAITGPVARGDAATVAGQLTALAAAAPDLLEICAALVAETRRQRRRAIGADAGGPEIDRAVAKARQRKSFLDPG